jgi:hypothetical protein
LKPIVYSFSFLDSFELCPLKTYKEKIEKSVPFTESEQTKWGNEVHKAIELAISRGAELPPRFAGYKKVVDRVLGLQGTPKAELALGMRKDFSACGFFDSDVFVRGKADLVLEYPTRLAALDWKTGKQKNGSRQLALMAILLFALYPGIDEIFTAFVWLQTNKITSEVFKRHQIADLWEGFAQTISEVEWCVENNKWPARENFLCKSWCGVFDCVYNGRRKSEG